VGLKGLGVALGAVGPKGLGVALGAVGPKGLGVALGAVPKGPLAGVLVFDTPNALILGGGGGGGEGGGRSELDNASLVLWFLEAAHLVVNTVSVS
jgi:hypothetical protein